MVGVQSTASIASPTSPPSLRPVVAPDWMERRAREAGLATRSAERADGAGETDLQHRAKQHRRRHDQEAPRRRLVRERFEQYLQPATARATLRNLCSRCLRRRLGPALARAVL
eukprot:1328415-Prymnesium_polylepis.2